MAFFRDRFQCVSNDNGTDSQFLGLWGVYFIGLKLEVGHPPGAPFFMLTANLFTQFASDPSQVALMVNSMSALFSGLTILFLFWSITHLARKVVLKDGKK
jgi:hypothetical protein